MRYAAILMALVLVSPRADAFEEWELDNLRGITDVHVMVETLTERDHRLGFTHDTLRTDAELKLRLAGIKVVSRERVHENNVGVLYIALNSAPVAAGDCAAANLEVKLNVWAAVLREHPIRRQASVWESASITLRCPSAVLSAFVRVQLLDHLDKFVNVYLAANPKTPNTEGDSK